MTDIYVNDRLLAGRREKEGDAGPECGARAVLVERRDAVAHGAEHADLRRERVRDAARDFVAIAVRQRYVDRLGASPRSAEAARHERAPAGADADAAAAEPDAAREVAATAEQPERAAIDFGADGEADLHPIRPCVERLQHALAEHFDGRRGRELHAAPAIV